MKNLKLAYNTLEEVILSGVQEFVVCPGARNVPWVQVLVNDPSIKVWWGYEERSSAFFALGRSRALQAPVAVLTTSGTAVGELLPACMEAFYTSVPLVLMTADRPRRYRHTGAPQTCVQPGIFGSYVETSFDLEALDTLSLKNWQARAPIHINVSFEDPEKRGFHTPALPKPMLKTRIWPKKPEGLYSFLDRADKLLVVISTLRKTAQAPVARFLESLGSDVYIEAVSGLREQFSSVEPDLNHYTHVLRIGGIPTHRFWRDLESHPQIEVFSVTEDPFSGLPEGKFSHCNLETLEPLGLPKAKVQSPRAPKKGLLTELSEKIAPKSHIYLGNSLPIRHWDLFATNLSKGFHITASRGLNGIDGQLSTFFGLMEPGVENWAILGDLTTLYDLSAPWFLRQIKDMKFTLVILNNGGGRIFEPMFPIPEMINAHDLSFEPFAKLWGLNYEKWDRIPGSLSFKESRVIEIV